VIAALAQQANTPAAGLWWQSDVLAVSPSHQDTPPSPPPDSAESNATGRNATDKIAISSNATDRDAISSNTTGHARNLNQASPAPPPPLPLGENGVRVSLRFPSAVSGDHLFAEKLWEDFNLIIGSSPPWDMRTIDVSRAPGHLRPAAQGDAWVTLDFYSTLSYAQKYLQELCGFVSLGRQEALATLVLHEADAKSGCIVLNGFGSVGAFKLDGLTDMMADVPLSAPIDTGNCTTSQNVSAVHAIVGLLAGDAATAATMGTSLMSNQWWATALSELRKKVGNATVDSISQCATMSIETAPLYPRPPALPPVNPPSGPPRLTAPLSPPEQPQILLSPPAQPSPALPGGPPLPPLPPLDTNGESAALTSDDGGQGGIPTGVLWGGIIVCLVLISASFCACFIFYGSVMRAFEHCCCCILAAVLWRRKAHTYWKLIISKPSTHQRSMLTAVYYDEDTIQRYALTEDAAQLEVLLGFKEKKYKKEVEDLVFKADWHWLEVSEHEWKEAASCANFVRDGSGRFSDRSDTMKDALPSHATAHQTKAQEKDTSSTQPSQLKTSKATGSMAFRVEIDRSGSTRRLPWNGKANRNVVNAIQVETESTYESATTHEDAVPPAASAALALDVTQGGDMCSKVIIQTYTTRPRVNLIQPAPDAAPDAAADAAEDAASALATPRAGAPYQLAEQYITANVTADSLNDRATTNAGSGITAVSVTAKLARARMHGLLPPEEPVPCQQII